jgi:hypothetical protein
LQKEVNIAERQSRHLFEKEKEIEEKAETRGKFT